MRLKSISGAFVAFALAIPTLVFAQMRPTAMDVAGMSSVSDPQLSGDGRVVVYTLKTWDFDPDSVQDDEESKAGWSSDQQLWLAPADGSAPARQITFGEESASSPRFAPDGRWLAFLRKQDGDRKIHLLRLSSGVWGGGETQILDTGDLSPESLQIAPDSRTISFIATPPMSDAEKEAKQASGGAVRFGEEWRNARLYSMSSETGEVTELTDGSEHVIDYAWSPAAHQVAIVASESADPYHSFSLRTVKLIDARTGEVERVLEEEPGAIGHIAWSPRMRYIAYEKGENSLSLLNALVVHSLRGGPSKNVVASLDPTLSGFVWSEDGNIVAHVYEKTKSQFYSISPDGQRIERIASPGVVFGESFATDTNRRVAVGVASTPSSAPNPMTVNLKTGATNTVADVHPYTSDWDMAVADVFAWDGPEGTKLEGVLWRTPLARNGAPAPLMVLPHGGPDSVTTENFSSWAQFFAARGFHVFRPNYRGGFGYGHDFYAANRGRLGEIEFMDIESGVDALIDAGIADPARLVYGGWSWGGFCTAYTIAHTNRYQAAVAGAAVTDTVNQYALSDINHGVAAEWEYTTVPWTNFEPFDDASAVRHLEGATTPTLIIHGMADDRVPFGQGITLYRALKDVGCEVEFLAYPREPHGFREPAHTAHMLQAWADWYAEHLSGN